jgi:hypothetical protein
MSGYVAGAGLLASAAGAAVNGYAQNQALKRQDNVAAAGIRQQGMLRDQANQVVQKTVQNTATDEQANLQANKQKQQTAYLAALQRAAPTQNASTPAVAGASKAYADAAASATKDNAQFGRTLADQMSTTDAPLLTQNQTNLQLGDASTQLGLINDTSNRQANLARLQEQAITANPWLEAAGGVLSGAGSGLMTKGSGKKAPPVVDQGASLSGGQMWG